MMNWKIIVGGLLIFAGIAQLMRLITEYQNDNLLTTSLGLGLLFSSMLLLGIYLVRQGRKEDRNKP
jgi:drug/metabolite transporter (DMT)-like permease